jgi:hypothetical protein
MLREMLTRHSPSAGSRPVAIGSRSIGVSLQPAIPRRVAPQQSPLPLHRSPSTVAQSRSAEAIKSLLNRTAGRQSRSRSSCPPPTRVSSPLCAPGVISILRRHRSCAPYRGMLVGTKGVPTMSTTPPAGRTKGCRKNLPNDPRLENGETGAEAEQRTSPWPHEVLARL